MTALPQEKRCTYGDLSRWDDGVRYELYDGVPVAMSSPTMTHQLISGELFRQLANFLFGKPCKVFSAPFDVRIYDTAEDRPEDSENVLQPDLLVVCDREKLDERGVRGAPTLVIEILSPSTLRSDRLVKFHMYEKAGVPEYWIVDPERSMVTVHVLDEGKYPSGTVYLRDAALPAAALPGCVIDLNTVFPA